MAFGKVFEEAFQKALRMSDDVVGFDPTIYTVCEDVSIFHLKATLFN